MDIKTLADHVVERYRSYLETSFQFRDPQLNKSFSESLADGHLAKGPFLELTPIFQTGAHVDQLFAELLSRDIDPAFLSGLFQGPLYLHQDAAIRKAFAGRNIVVATGTGSGKTESFLYAILLDLYKQFLEGKRSTGVRALILYPLNALANDQRERLGSICEKLKEKGSRFCFSFGQYVGSTPEDESDRYRDIESVLDNRFEGELALRSEMRESPPDILLTNYSMLEYLLLRPDDSPLFDMGRALHWKYLVLDEAHQYRGAKGIEMALLLRRLKHRLRRGGRKDPFVCVATSATLVGSSNESTAVAEFASKLFGEEFSEQGVILASHVKLSEPWSIQLAQSDYSKISNLWGNDKSALKSLSELAVRHNVSGPRDAHDDPQAALGLILKQDKRFSYFKELLSQDPLAFDRLAELLFPELSDANEQAHALSGFLRLAIAAKDPHSQQHLVSLRSHVFLRALEGAYVAFWPQKRVVFRRGELDQGIAFELALCKGCGEHYLVGKIASGKLVEAIRDASNDKFEVDYFRTLDLQSAPEDDQEDDSGPGETLLLCTECGQIDAQSLRCGHRHSIKVRREHKKKSRNDEERLRECSACGSSRGEPVREVIYGNDAPNAVIVTALHEHLPKDRRKILAFSDGRQAAAFFAWYLEQSYQEFRERSAMLKAAREGSSPSQPWMSMSSVVDHALASHRELFTRQASEDEHATRKNIWKSLYKEFLTDEKRISLQGVGLISWEIDWPKWISAPAFLLRPPWSLTQEQALDVLFILLDYVRQNKAVELVASPQVAVRWDELELEPRQKRVSAGTPSGEKDLVSWEGKKGRRFAYLDRLLEKISPTMSAEQRKDFIVHALEGIWNHLFEAERQVPVERDRLLWKVKNARRLNPAWWRLKCLAETDKVFICQICSSLQASSVHGVCSRTGCVGQTAPIGIAKLKPNHYRTLYLAELPGLRAEEHTAQLSKPKAILFQQHFKEGRINLLSCSTTFELGVDLGDLDIIFLRNVPPESFNYVQRVGRAGRRSGAPGFAVTYCRRNPHDLFHFADPMKVIKGAIVPPSLEISNPKIILRHIAATALSEFFRHSQYGGRFNKVIHFLIQMDHPEGVSAFRAFLRSHAKALEEDLHHIVPDATLNKLGLSDGAWMDMISGENSSLALAEREVSGEYANLTAFKESSIADEKYDDAKWAKARIDTISSEDIISFLSRKAVIPKYGFPVDVVELDTQQTNLSKDSLDVLLQRDLSIAVSEFAPTSELVANKKLWTSYGVKRVLAREFERRFYKYCSKHNMFRQWEKGQPEPATACDEHGLDHFEYIIPRFGFVTSREGPEEPKGLPQRLFTTRPFFIGSVGAEPNIISLPSEKNPVLHLRKAAPGKMAVLCEGRRREGFYVCSTCGAGFRKPVSTHLNAFGQKCDQALSAVSLGHEFQTDVVQIQFLLQPQLDSQDHWFSYSLAYALVEGIAEVLQVPSNDLNTTVSSTSDMRSSWIVLYDNVPGGAGIVARLEDKSILVNCLEAALKRVSGICGCGEQDSCYGCLRNYRNQFAHTQLKRGDVKSYLEHILLSLK